MKTIISNFYIPRLLIFLSLSAVSSGILAGDYDKHNRSSAKDAVADLIYCYARGTDAIGDATTDADPLGAGYAIYQDCFVEDAVFRVWFPHQPFDSQTFPDAALTPPTASVDSTFGWADFVNGVFRGNGYDFTQHIISNVDVNVKGNRATATAYLNASHVISGDAIGGESRCVAIANGTYSIKAKRHRGKWRATSLDLTLITFNPTFQTGTGCAP